MSARVKFRRCQLKEQHNDDSGKGSTTPLVSIVVPVFNIAHTCKEFVSHVVSIAKLIPSFEICIVDDGSNDKTYSLIDSLLKGLDLQITLLRLESNGGPGIARNRGVQSTKGKFIMFLDSDDSLDLVALTKLSEYLRYYEKEILYFDFIPQDQEDGISERNIIRRDHLYFSDSHRLMQGWLEWKIYQECMFAAYKRDFLERNGILFAKGYYEDIYFGTQCAAKVTEFELCKLKVYKKTRTRNSITSTFSVKYIYDYIQVLIDMRKFVLEMNKSLTAVEGAAVKEFQVDWNNAIINRIQVLTLANVSQDLRFRYFRKYRELLEKNDLWKLMTPPKKNREPSANADIYRYLMAIDSLDSPSLTQFFNSVTARLKKFWSCADIESSVFFAPNEIRTCCKRFFVDGEIKGDVVLDVPTLDDDFGVNETVDRKRVEAEQIRTAKRNLFRSINLAEDNPCRLCPYLELGENWNNFEKDMQINYISMEQHSVCNLRCSYCDEKYYGGLLPDYDLLASVESLLKSGALSDLKTVVWGGGEPILDPNFGNLLSAMKSTSQSCEHRFLSNGVRYSNEIAETLSTTASMLVTSIDAGDEEIYTKVRGRKGFIKSLTNLRTYLSIAPNSIIIKFIFTEGNKSLDTIRNFVQAIDEFKLQNAFFQISFDFKDEVVNENDLIFPLVMYAELYHANAKFIFFDDLLTTRLRSGLSRRKGRELLMSKGYSTECLAEPISYKECGIVLFGAGDQAKIMNSRFGLLKNWPISAIVETGIRGAANRTFAGHPIGNLNDYRDSSERIVLAGVQSIPKMFNSAMGLGISRDRIIRELFLS